MSDAVSPPVVCGLHPGKLTWNLIISQLKREVISQTSIFGFNMLNFPGVQVYYFPHTLKVSPYLNGNLGGVEGSLAIIESPAYLAATRPEQRSRGTDVLGAYRVSPGMLRNAMNVMMIYDCFTHHHEIADMCDIPCHSLFAFLCYSQMFVYFYSLSFINFFISSSVLPFCFHLFNCFLIIPYLHTYILHEGDPRDDEDVSPPPGLRSDGYASASWHQQGRDGSWWSSRRANEVTPIGSMGLTFLQTWMVDFFYGKCR